MNTMKANGSCLCGSVHVRAEAMCTHVGACHCNMCRKWTGGPMLTVDCHSAVQFTGEDHITIYQSSDWAERDFCTTCGTHLFYRLKQADQYIIPVGVFDAQTKLQFTEQIFMDEKPSYYAFSNHTHEMTGAEVFAQYESDAS